MFTIYKVYYPSHLLKPTIQDILVYAKLISIREDVYQFLNDNKTVDPSEEVSPNGVILSKFYVPKASAIKVMGV